MNALEFADMIERYTARDEQTADFEALLAAHRAMPGESCALVDWRQGAIND